MVRKHAVEQVSLVAAPVDAVWQRVTSFDGIRDELGPWMSMSIPRGADHLDVTTVPLGDPIGRSWITLFGVIPVDYDDLTIVAVEPGRSFHERSTMLSASRWEHQRVLTPVGGRTQVHDRLTFVSRLPFGGALHAVVVRRLFAHRHRRLARHFA
ncbi:hypothetical protein [Aeromicrobium sp. CF3.5]|uniref:hypothetical protein n=1 Tax=Aeromicrobium sp. CF3.5 TaxID=3373078 RepID=UPI003EE7BB08